MARQFKPSQLTSGSYSISGSFSGSFQGNGSKVLGVITSSYAHNADLLDGRDSTTYANTGSNIFVGQQVITGSLLVTSSHISTVDYIDFNTTSPAPVHNEGRIHWLDESKTLNVDTDINNFYIEVGHQNVVRFVNRTGAALSVGTIIYINGEYTQVPTVATASSDSDLASISTLGFIAQQVNYNDFGYIITNGLLRGIDTTAYIAGTQLYLSASGTYTAIAPISPEREVRLGKVITQDVSGSIYVNIMNGYRFDDLTDVLISSASTGDLPIWNNNLQLWQNTKELTGSYSLSGSLNVTSATGSFTGSFYGNGEGIFSGSFSGSVSSNLQEVTNNGSITTNAITSSGLQTNDLYVIGTTNLTGSATLNGSPLVTNEVLYPFTASYLIASASFDSRILTNSASISSLSGSFLNSSSSFDSRILTNSASISSLSGSYLNSSSSFDSRINTNLTSINSLTAVTGSYATTGSNTFIGNQTINGNISINGTASIAFLNVQYESASVIYSSGSNQFGDAANDTQTLYGLVTIPTGSLQVSGGITGSLLGTSSFAVTASYIELAQTASNILGGKATHIPYFITDTTLATSSIYQSGSTSIIINQDANTTANPEALYVWQPSTSSFNVISGKGNLDNYLQLNIQNTNQGLIASSDVVATANNGNELTNYIDMGINNENFSGDIGGPNDAYLYSTGEHLHIGNASNKYVAFFAGGTDVDVNNKLLLSPNNYHEMTGSLDISDSLLVRDGITGSLHGTASYATQALSASYAINADLLDGKNSTEFATTSSNTFIGNQTITGSLNINGSTTQIGNNNLLGNTVLSGSVNISGNTVMTGSITAINLTASFGYVSASFLDITGKQTVKGFSQYIPTSDIVPISVTGGYIYSSGSEGDLYFAQTNGTLNNVIRLRWLEGNMYSGLLNGALISTQSSTTYQVSSGSGIIVNLNGSLSSDPYPTVNYINWPNLSASIAPLSASYDQTFVAIQATGSAGKIYVQGTPYDDGQFNTLIPIGNVIHQNRTSINATATYPSVAYGYKQRSSDFIRAFGPLKLSGLNAAVSGSSTGSLIITSGTAYSEGRNYIADPNNPSYVIDTGTTISKIFRYYQSGSSWVYLTNGGAGFQTIDPTQYANNGVLTPVPGTGANREFTIQRIFWFPGGATKGIYVYYGNATYQTLVEAVANIPYENFIEAPNTAAGSVLSAYLILRNNADFTDVSSYLIQQGGLFRNIGGSGGGGSTITQTLFGLSDVAISGPTNGQPLVYNLALGKWQNQSTLTATLLGNASTSTSSSYSDTASFAYNSISSSYAMTASYLAGYVSPFPYTGSAIITGSLIVTGSTISTLGFTGSLFGTSSWALNSISSSYAISSSNSISSSYALIAESVIGSVTSASYAATASHSTNFVVSNTLEISGTLTDRATVLSTIVGSNNLFTQATGSYRSAFGKYTVSNGANARMGEFWTVWNGTTTTYTDTSTPDIGTTSAITFSSTVVGSNIQINAIAAGSGWTITMLTTFI